MELFSLLTKEFKAVSPSKKTALIVCMFIINCHKKGTKLLFRTMKLSVFEGNYKPLENLLRIILKSQVELSSQAVQKFHKLNLQPLSTYKIKVVIFDSEKWNNYEPKDAICQHNSTCIHLSRTTDSKKVSRLMKGNLFFFFFFLIFQNLQNKETQCTNLENNLKEITPKSGRLTPEMMFITKGWIFL